MTNFDLSLTQAIVFLVVAAGIVVGLVLWAFVAFTNVQHPTILQKGAFALRAGTGVAIYCVALSTAFQSYMS